MTIPPNPHRNKKVECPWGGGRVLIDARKVVSYLSGWNFAL
jgi:hypothetical protein